MNVDMRLSILFLYSVAALLGSCWVFSAPVSAAPLPVEQFAVRNVVTSVAVSPDGKYLALIKHQPRSGESTLEVFDTDALGEDPFRVSHEPMQLLNLAWIADSKLMLSLLKQVDEQQAASLSVAMSIVDVKRERVRLVPEPNPVISSYWPTVDHRIVMSLPIATGEADGVDAAMPMPSFDSVFSLGRNAPGIRSTSTTDPVAELVYGDFRHAKGGMTSRFSPREYFGINLRTYKKLRLLKLSSEIAQIEVDGDGKPWLGRGVDTRTFDYVWYVPAGEKGDWKEIFRLSMTSPEIFHVDGFDVSDRNILFVTATNGGDKAGLWEFNADRAVFGELIYRRPDADVVGARFHSNAWAEPDTVTGLVYYTDKEHVEYFDASEAALIEQLAKLIPASFHLTITSRSKDGGTLTIHNVGPQDPGSNYLLRNDTLKLLGGSNPLLSSTDLAPMKFVRYKSADGTKVPAYVTVPHGAEAFPTVLLLRHEPGTREVVDYDVLAQVLANNGYLVVQPLLRGTGEFSQADASAAIDYFIKQGMADRDRIALFGWGYDAGRALQAASLTAQAYQCVMAAITSTPTVDPQNRGWLPLASAEALNVPVFLVRSGINLPSAGRAETDDYLAALKKYGKAYQVSSLGEQDLAYGEKLFDDRTRLFTSMIDFLTSDCGPGGL